MKSLVSSLMATVMVVLLAVAEGTTTRVNPIVDTDYGQVSGIVEESLKGQTFYSFYGLPFAQPPVGKLRFKDPVEPSPWEGTHDASTPGARCPQLSFSAGLHNIDGQEDCLHLNVFTPKTKHEDGWPVMVFIHGGAFFTGSAQESEPYVLMNKNIVLVVVQYRLGALGFLSTEDSVMPGNLGLKDQTMALQWVQRNIHHFGGDKTRVTIFGESAGGASVHFQMLTPKSEGLFSRAILQSGTALCPWALNTNPRKAALRVAGLVGCPADEGSQALLECLQGLNATVVVPLHGEFFEWNFLPFVFAPWVDGDYLPDHPGQLLRKGQQAKVDIMAGVTRDEGAAFAGGPLRDGRLFDKFHNSFSVAGPASLTFTDHHDEEPEALARRVFLHYSGTTHVTKADADSLTRMFGDRLFTVCHDLTTAHHAALFHPAKKTFRYELQHRGQLSLLDLMCPSCPHDWVCHADELFYLFPYGPFSQNIFPSDLQLPEDLALRDIVTTLWTNFAATGNPTPDDSLGFKWQPSTEENLHYLSLTPLPSMQPDNRKETRKFHNSLPTTLNFLLHPHLVEKEAGAQEGDSHHVKTEL